MTRERATELLKGFQLCCDFAECNNAWDCEECVEALNMAIQALEQEPSEDTVSRQALLDKAYAYGNGLEPEGYCVEVEDIQALPSVVPTRKKGKLIAIDDTHDQCMECGAIFCITSSDEWEVNYCPNCGARIKKTVAEKMIEALEKDQKRGTRPKMEQEILPKHCIVPPSDAVPSAEPNEDCISRKRLRESLKQELLIVNNNEMYWQGWHDCTVAVETRITDAPSVVPSKNGE